MRPNASSRRFVSPAAVGALCASICAGVAGPAFAAEGEAIKRVSAAASAEAGATAAASTAKRPPKRTAKNCKPSRSKLGVARTITLDTKGGPKFGFVNYPSTKFLEENEVLLTFDDGPLPRYTNPILKALEKECTRATFFLVGRMSVAFPKSVKRIMREGHTVGTHTWSHGNLQRTGSARAVDQIERGIAAIEAAAGEPIAPIFRFPYLGRTGVMESHLKKRNISVFSIDVDSRDTRGYSAPRMIRHTISRLKARKGGIVLFHDIKRATAQAIPGFLRELRRNGFRIVHLETNGYAKPNAKMLKRYRDYVAARTSGDREKMRIARKALKDLPARNKAKKRVQRKVQPNSSIKPVASTRRANNPFSRSN
ncbi:MAG: polysaccharide deacetylase family protein [Pseudomonadota bacterium]